jgi:hypothetical protein
VFVVEAVEHARRHEAVTRLLGSIASAASRVSATLATVACLKEALSLLAYGEAVAAQRAPTGHAAEA